MKKTFYVFALALAMAACNPGKESTETTAEETVQAAGTGLFDKQWNLAEIKGNAVVLDSSFHATPHLTFTESDSSVAGNAGCNQIGGGFMLTGSDGITFTKMRSTLMACPNLEVEQQFVAELENIKKYRIEGTTLLLNNENSETLLKLEGIDKP
ncbi:META domain-containing protein [Leadbetterella sp. DM7]|uniref:META domain-containing protein n=1 Tax=Leadbetterella sp. DM7 TaxID=3235085 RepID=UPI00349EC420